MLSSDFKRLGPGDLIRADQTTTDVYFLLDFSGEFFIYSRKLDEDTHEIIGVNQQDPMAWTMSSYEMLTYFCFVENCLPPDFILEI